MELPLKKKKNPIYGADFPNGVNFLSRWDEHVLCQCSSPRHALKITKEGTILQYFSAMQVVNGLFPEG
jgi:hypothetical protein